jgi:acetylornithine deacetylase/succinyl-diaminopimelate desuccinylase-like protein
MKRGRRYLERKVVLPLMAALAFASSGASADGLTPEQQRFHSIYKELIEINTTHSVGDVTKAAQAMGTRLQESGFAPADMQVFEPYPRKGNLVARFKGDNTKRPLLLLAHLDVVEAKREDWEADPFQLQETNGYFTARGTIDDKAMAAAFVSVLGQLKREGFKPKRDIILALTADEERLDVPSNGAKWLINNQRQLLDAEFGINEGGGGELRNGKPNLQRIQVAEKLYTSFELELRDPGGHSSLPTASNPIYPLSAALARLGAYRFAVNLNDVTKTYFSRSAQMATGQLADDMRAMASGHPDDASIERLSAFPLYNALIRTTCVATMLNAGHAENALPQSAKATVNCRILPQEDPEGVAKQLKQALGNDKILVRNLNPALKSPASPLANDLVAAVEGVTKEMWPEVPVIPFMSTSATDSRYLRNAGIPMYGVTGLFIESSDARAHGLNERIEIPRLYDGREFLYRLVKRLAS